MANVYHYRPEVSFWPKPPATGGTKVWSDDYLLDNLSGKYRRKPSPERWKEYCKASKRKEVKEVKGEPKLVTVSLYDPYAIFPGMRSRFSSTKLRKAHRGGPYHGMLLRRWITVDTTPKHKVRGRVKRLGAKQVTTYQALPDVHVVEPWHGRYVWQESQDSYVWQDGGAVEQEPAA